MLEWSVFFWIVGVVFTLTGYASIKQGQADLLRVIPSFGSKLVLKGGISVWVYGVLFMVGGALSVLTGFVQLISLESDLLDALMITSITVAVSGFFGSMLVELVYFLAGLPPYDEQERSTHHEERYKKLSR